jgi:hypothetical protein
MGLGLLYEGTGHRFIALLLLHELSRRPAVDKQIEREAATWAAGYCDRGFRIVLVLLVLSACVCL